MTTKHIFFTVAIGFFIASCQNPVSHFATVNGSFTDAKGFKLTLQEMDTHAIRSVDSIVPGADGTFKFLPAVREPGFWLLKAATGKIMVLLLNEGDLVELSGSVSNFPDNVVMNGPKEAMLLNDFFRQTRRNEHQVDSLEMILAEHQDSADYYRLTQKFDTVFRHIWENQRKVEIAFIDNNPGSIASLIVLNYAFGTSSVLDPQEDSVYYRKLDLTLFRKFPENKHVKYHHQRVLQMH